MRTRRHSSRRTAVAKWTAAVLALVALAAFPAAAGAVEPIEGTWAYQGGRVLVEPSGPGAFKGTVTAATRFLSCDHPVGERMWSISGRGSAYSGTHQWFEEPGCAPAPGGSATWTVRDAGDVFLLDFCTAPPGEGAPTPENPATRCSTLQRARPPAPTPQQVCVADACLIAPGEAQAIGCIPRTDFTHRFVLRLRRSVRRRLRVRVVRFTLDGARNGSDRRAPFVARVRGSALAPGRHVLGARVRIVRRGSRRTVRRVLLRYTFRACD